MTISVQFIIVFMFTVLSNLTEMHFLNYACLSNAVLKFWPFLAGRGVNFPSGLVENSQDTKFRLARLHEPRRFMVGKKLVEIGSSFAFARVEVGAVLSRVSFWEGEKR